MNSNANYIILTQLALNLTPLQILKGIFYRVDTKEDLFNSATLPEH